MGRSSYNHVGTGGEARYTSDPYWHIGFIASRSNKLRFFGNSTWYSYCYTNTHNNVALDGGTIGACGPYPAPDWTTTYQ